MEFLEKSKYRTTTWSRNPTSGYILQGIEITISKRCLCPYGICSTIHNGQDNRNNPCLFYSSDQISRSVVSDSLLPHELQHARPPCPSPTPGVHSDSSPSSQWCHPATHPLSSPSPPAPNPSQHQSLFQWVKSSHEVLNKVPQKKLISLYVPNIFRPHLNLTIYIYLGKN